MSWRLQMSEAKKAANKPKMIEHLEMIAPIIAFPMYWTNRDCMVLGANEATLRAMGAPFPDVVIGKTPYDYYPKELAEGIVQQVKTVVETGETLSREDKI